MQNVDAFDELFADSVIRYTVQFLQLVFVAYRPHQGDALPVFEIVHYGLLDLPGILIHLFIMGLIRKAVLEVLRRTYLPPFLVLYLQSEVPQHPQEFGHVPVQVLLVIPVAEFLIGFDLFAQGCDHFYFAEGALVDGAD